MMENSFDLFSPGNSILVSSKCKNYHSFYKVCTWMIKNAGNDIKNLILQTSLNYLFNIDGKDLPVWLDFIGNDTNKLDQLFKEFDEINNELKQKK